MSRNAPNLQVVSSEGAAAALSLSSGSLAPGALEFLDIVSIAKLGPAERKKVERIVQHVSPDAEVVGAARPSPPDA